MCPVSKILTLDPVSTAEMVHHSYHLLSAAFARDDNAGLASLAVQLTTGLPNIYSKKL